MAVRTKSVNKNRYKKVYPRFREQPQPGLMSTGKVVLDAKTVSFNDESSKTVSFSGYYENNIPSVTLTPVGDINNVNLFITSVSITSVASSGGRTVTVVIESSAAFTGTVNVQVMQV